MAQFNYVVDTNPMAATVDTVSGHITATTAAVAAMETAVILTEKESAETICSNIDRGFYCLIQSQITTKKAKAISELRAKFIELQQMSKALMDKHNRMESDVARLKREYGRTFGSIDKALEHRISELDRDAYALSSVRKRLISDRPLKSVPEAICADREAGILERMAFTARLKSKTARALDTIGRNISDSEKYKNSLEHVLDEVKSTGSPREYIPVMVVNLKSLSVKDADVMNVMTPDGLSEQTGTAIRNAVMNDGESVEMQLPTDREQAEIRKEFQKIASSAQMTDRVYDTLMDLFINGGH